MSRSLVVSQMTGIANAQNIDALCPQAPQEMVTFASVLLQELIEEIILRRHQAQAVSLLQRY